MGTGVSLSQFVTAFIVANGVTILIHLYIMIRTGGSNDEKLKNMDRRLDASEERIQQYGVDIAMLKERTEALRYRRGGDD